MVFIKAMVCKKDNCIDSMILDTIAQPDMQASGVEPPSQLEKKLSTSSEHTTKPPATPDSKSYITISNGDSK